MNKYNPGNERIKRGYVEYLKAVRGHSEATLTAALKAVHRFEVSTNFRDFRKFHIQQAIAFRKHLTEAKSTRTGKPLSHSTVLQTLEALRSFFRWLASRPGYRSKIRYPDADYFGLSTKDARIAKAPREHPVPTLEQIRHVLATVPASTDVERRDRALIAFMLLTGVRDGALCSLKLKHVNLAERKVHQDAAEVRTKFAKTFATWFFPVGEDVLSIVEEWVSFLREDRLWSDCDPLFPATAVVNGPSRQFEVASLSRNHWAGAGPIRAIFRRSFSAAGQPYFNPHSFRKTLAQLSQRMCRTPEDIKAWSQNLEHEDVLTIFRSYGTVASSQQAEIIRNLGQRGEPEMDAGKALETLHKFFLRGSAG